MPQVVFSLLVFVAITLIISALGTIYGLVSMRVTLVDVHGAEFPTEYTDVFKIYLVEYLDENKSEHVVSYELSSGITYRKISNGSYNLRVYYDSASSTEDQRTLLYDEPVRLRGSRFFNMKIPLENVMVYYEIYVAPPDFKYPDIITNKVVIKEMMKK